ncbi:MAG: protein-L-isoaspartate O-methyltransferase [Spirulina sp.]
MNLAATYQQQLLERIRLMYSDEPLSLAVEQAYLNAPRHLFIKRYRDWGSSFWYEINEQTLEQHLSVLYANRSLILFGEDDAHIPSTISQPSLVLRMLDMLDIRPGDRIFELGGGSGWNAALMGYLTGKRGHVYSLEIIPEMARMAAETLRSLGIDNVSAIAGDGGKGYALGTPYQRAIFTAGTYDIPHYFYEQIEENGLLLTVLKTEGLGDRVVLLCKRGPCFASLEESIPCSFVEMTGEYQLEDPGEISLEDVSEWQDLQQLEISTIPFWWGGKDSDRSLGKTLGIRSFLRMTEPDFQYFNVKVRDSHKHELRDYNYFGLWDREHHSLVLAKDDCLIAYGNTIARDRLIDSVKHWIELGRPSESNFKLKIYPIDFPVRLRKNQWLVKRQESQFLWVVDN